MTTVPDPTRTPRAGAELIAAERHRQVAVEGYTADHDRGRAHELLGAANAYRVSAFRAHLGLATMSFRDAAAYGWPWAEHYWKPTGDPVRDLAKSGALTAAAIDSIQEARS